MSVYISRIIFKGRPADKLVVLSDEIQTAMRLMGVNDVDELNPSYVNTALLKLEMPQLDRERMLGKL